MNVITVSYGLVKGEARKYPYYQPAMYESHTTKDGRDVWKYVSHMGIARRSLKLAIKDAEDIAKEEKCGFEMGVGQWDRR